MTVVSTSRIKPLLKVVLVIFILCSNSLVLNAQNSNDSRKIEAIKSNALYYWGEASSSDHKQAQDLALKTLIEKIEVTVSSSFENTFNETTTKDDSNYLEMTQGFVRSYSNATLREVQTIQDLRAKGQLYVFRYIQKSAVDALFKEREDLVNSLFSEAESAANNLNYSYALKYYYNSLILLNSIPRAIEPYQGLSLLVEIPKRINTLLDQISINYIESISINDQEIAVSLEVSAKGKPLKQLSFTFWDGNQSVEAEAKDGVASIRLYGASTGLTELRCSPMFSFHNSRFQIDELAKVWDAMPNKPNFPRSIKVVLANEKKPTKMLSANGAVVNTSLADGLTLENEAIELLQTNLKHFADNNGLENAANVDPLFNQKWNAIKKFNAVSFSGLPFSPIIAPTWEDVEVREIPVTNVYKSLDLQTTEYVILDAQKQGEYYDVNYGIMKGLYAEIKEQALYGEDWKERQVLIKFLEKYRTAFMTRDMETLNEIFSDEARIIVGKKIRPGTANGQSYSYKPEGKNLPDYSYVELKKKEYLNNLSSLFSRVQDIYTGYTTFQILRKNNLPGTYGVSMRQDYMSTGYADEGYLFLLIDFNHEKPQIMVRSWQPQEWREDALIELSDFQIYK